MNNFVCCTRRLIGCEGWDQGAGSSGDFPPKCKTFWGQWVPPEKKVGLPRNNEVVFIIRFDEWGVCRVPRKWCRGVGGYVLRLDFRGKRFSCFGAELVVL